MGLSDKVRTAKRAINEVFKDTSESPNATRDALRELEEEISVLLDALPVGDDA